MTKVWVEAEIPCRYLSLFSIPYIPQDNSLRHELRHCW